MTYKKARTVLLIGCALMGVLFFVGAALRSGAVILLGGALALAGAVVWILFGTCPECGKFIGRTGARFCPHCGEKLE